MKTFLLLAFVFVLSASAQNVGLTFSPDPHPVTGQHPGQPGYDGECYLENYDGQRVTVVVYTMGRHSGQQTTDDSSYFGTYTLDPGQRVDLGSASWFLLADAVGEVGYDTFYLESAAYTQSNRAPVISWTIAPANAASGQAYTVAAHGHDDDGNLAQVKVWKNGQPFAFAGGGDGTDGDSGNPSADDGPQGVTYTAQTVDGAGAASPVITLVVTIEAPTAPAQHTLVTGAGAGGSVSGGGTYDAGTVVTVTATPDGTHDFSGWSGDAGGSGNPVSLVLDADKTVQANFSLKLFALSTSATAGGNVTPGGSYPYGTSVTIGATPDSTHRFIGWAGDAGGTTPSLLVTLTSPLNVQAVFTDKTGQAITFPSPGSLPAGGPAVTLSGTASSGLPVAYAVLSGPGTLTGNQLMITGPGAVTVQASQAGDSVYLPAANITQTINVSVAAILKYRPNRRTFLQESAAVGTAPFVLEIP